MKFPQCDCKQWFCGSEHWFNCQLLLLLSSSAGNFAYRILCENPIKKNFKHFRNELIKLALICSIPFAWSILHNDFPGRKEPTTLKHTHTHSRIHYIARNRNQKFNNNKSNDRQPFSIYAATYNIYCVMLFTSLQNQFNVWFYYLVSWAQVFLQCMHWYNLEWWRFARMLFRQPKIVRIEIYAAIVQSSRFNSAHSHLIRSLSVDWKQNEWLFYVQNESARSRSLHVFK